MDAAPPATADELRALAHVWAIYLDPDGAEPRDTIALRRRGITLGTPRDGVIPIRGNLLVEVAAQLQRICDAVNNPKLNGPRFTDTHPRHHGDDENAITDDDTLSEDTDTRSRPQKQHDALAAALNIAAKSGDLPTLGGTAPTLVVSVRAEDLTAGRGYAQADGIDEPVSLGVARHIACDGTIQRVISDDTGRIVAIHTLDRVFTHQQRKAITLRDGGCLIPGCGIPASWCEIHHVHDHANGGPTHTDNGVLLCWHHHRTLDTNGWTIRMNHGTPEIRGPNWWDPYGQWRPTTTSRTRMLTRLTQRQ